MKQHVHEIRDLPLERCAASLSQFLGTVFLDSSDAKSMWSRFSYLGFLPFMTTSVSNGITTVITRSGQRSYFTNDPFSVLQSQYERFKETTTLDRPWTFSSGLMGCFSYEAARYFSDFSTLLKETTVPEILIGFYDRVLIFDHVERRLYLVVTEFPSVDNRFSISDFFHLIEENKLSSNALFLGQVEQCVTHEYYSQQFDRLKTYIRAGDCYQANLTCKYEVPILEDGNLFSFYTVLRRQSPAPFSAYLNWGDSHVFSSSPERFFSISDGHIQTRPIKGTAKRCVDPVEDARQKSALLASKKDAAELTMIVDLLRHDLAKVCAYGSVHVPELRTIEAYRYVYHLVATVEGVLNPSATFLDVFKSLFPGGSITGAPKIRAMEVISELEQSARNVYTGSIGYADFSGSCDFNIAIRTLYREAVGSDSRFGKLAFHVGGGIVADSVCHLEWDETLAKAEGMRRSINYFLRKGA